MPNPTTDPNAKLLILRDLLFEEDQSPETWESLCAALDDWPTDDSLHVAFDYIQGHLDRWPAELRVAPRRWWDVVRSGGHEPRFSIARKLSLAAYGGGARAVAALVGEPTMSQIAILDLSHNRLTPAEAVQLAASRHLGALRELDLGLNELGAPGVESLVRASWFGALERLDLTSNKIPDVGMTALASVSRCSLEVLVLWGNAMGPGAAEVLASSSVLTGLKRLNLGWNALGDAGAEALASAAWLGSLSHLDLSNNRLTEVGARALLDSPSVWGLGRVDLRGNAIGHEIKEFCRKHKPDWLV